MSILESAIGWLAPPQCISCGSEGSSLCLSCSGYLIPYGERCWKCSSLTDSRRTCPSCRSIGSPGRVWVVTNHEGLARKLLHDFKFEQNRIVVDSISLLMLATYLRSNQTSPDYLVVPVPTATGRVRERGFDHSALLAKRIARGIGLEYQPGLARLGQTRQVGSRRQERIKQMSGRFRVRCPEVVLGRKILLVDDVVTTGATLNSASNTLRAAGATRVDALIFAKRL